MVLTRSGRNAGVNGAADVAPQATAPGPPRPSGRGRGKATATSQEQQAQQHDDAPSSPTAAETEKLPFPKLPRRSTVVSEPLQSHANDLVAADTSDPPSLKFTEKQVMFSPRGATTSPIPAPVATPAHHLSSVQLPTEEDEETKEGAAAGTDAPPSRDQQPASPPPHVAPSSSPLKPPHTHGPVCRSRPPSPLSILLTALLVAAATAASLLSLCSPPFNSSLTRHLPPSPLTDAIARLPSTPACAHVNVAAARMRNQAALAHRSFLLHTAPLLATIQLHYTQLFPPPHSNAATTAPGPTASATAAPLAHHAHVRLLLQHLVPALAQPDAATTGPSALADAWEAAAELAAEKHKALGVLLPCSTADACAAATAHLTSSAPAADAPECAVELSLKAAAAAGPEAAGWLQRRLGEVMTACCGAQGQRCAGPRGLLAVVRGLDSSPLPVPLLSVLSNVLSESGNLQLGGQALPMHRATFVFPVALAAEEAQEGEEGGATYEEVARRGKDELVARLLAGGGGEEEGGSGEEERLQSVVKALRRRMDVVLQLAQ